MKVYHGTRTENGVAIVVEEANGECHGLDPRYDLRAHSDGFEWGYGGSGPAQLALALDGQDRDEVLGGLVELLARRGMK